MKINENLNEILNVIRTGVFSNVILIYVTNVICLIYSFKLATDLLHILSVFNK